MSPLKHGALAPQEIPEKLRASEQAPLHDFELVCSPLGVWSVTLDDGSVHERVVVVRAFPIAAPTEAVSILSAEGRELVWIERLDALPAGQRARLQEALTGREFMPEIQRLERVSSFATPSVWSVQTDRGSTDFVLKGEEDIRRLSATTLIVADAHGVQFLIRHLPSMDRHTRKLLDRFM
jgi:hypothetical protein